MQRVGQSCHVRFALATACALLFNSTPFAQCTAASSQKLLASNGAVNDGFGSSVAIDGSRAAVGSRNHTTVATFDGAVYSFLSSGGVWSEHAILTASDAAASDNFGASVAVSGSRTVAGATGDADQGPSTGSAYVFFDTTQEAKLVASDAAGGDLFAFAVGISGHRIVLGAPGDDDLGSNSGSAYVFEWTGSQWLQGAKLHASDGFASDRFGTSVAIDGDLVIVGARSTDQGASNAGSAYVFEWDGSGAWVQRAKLVASDPGSDDELGRSVDIDQQRAIVGAPLDAAGATGDNGSAYIFTRAGNIWTQTAKLTADDTLANRNFGYAVSLLGTHAFIGAHLDNSGGATAGAAYAFELSPATGQWQQRVKLAPPDVAANDNFGSALASSGATLFAGSIGDDDLGSSSGSVWTYDIPLSWSLRQQIFGTYNVGAYCGWSVSLGADTAVMGAPGDDDFGIKAGAAHVLDYNGSTWQATTKLYAADAAADDQFGTTVALAGTRIAVGAPYDGSFGGNPPGTGSVYVFVHNGSSWTQEIKLRASDWSAMKHFGRAVAMTDSWLAISADNDAVYAFRREGGLWVQKTKFISGNAAGEDFGYSVATTGDELVIGAPSPAIAGLGHVYAFRWTGTGWFTSPQLSPTINATDYKFGSAVAISGNRVLVGSPASTYFAGVTGCAVVFDRAGAGWSESQRLGPAGVSTPGFGKSLALWGERAVIGAPTGGAIGICSGWTGESYVFEYAGGSWTQRAELNGSYDAYNNWVDNAGIAVAISGDHILCGSPESGGLYCPGAGYFFGADCPGEWIANYCTAATTSSGCTAHISSSGTPSVSSPYSFSLLVNNVEGQKSGLIFYGVSGAIALPWGPTGYLCVQGPTQRLPAGLTQGTAGACDGSLSGGALSVVPGSVGTPFGAGDVMYAQGWFRDPPSAKTTNLSDALRIVLLP